MHDLWARSSRGREDFRELSARRRGRVCGADRVFRDVTVLNYGDDFEAVIDEKLSESGALIMMIGERWTSVTDSEGKRRLDAPAAYVSGVSSSG